MTKIEPAIPVRSSKGGFALSFIERIKQLAERAPSLAPALETEEATKNALVMPFISALGYDVFNPVEVIPEFTADVGVKKGEKVDYAIQVEGKVVMLWECKSVSAKLDLKHTSQLFRYFSVTQARIGVLTNGLVYRFFSDLEAPNKMDTKAFLELDLMDIRENRLKELERLTKSAFDLESMLESASDLKYMREVRRFLEAQFEEPSESFVKVCFQEANPQGRFSKSARGQFERITKRVLHQTVTDRVNDRLRNALAREEEPQTEAAPVEETSADDEQDPKREGIETTEDELLAFRIVRAIVCSVVDVNRVTLRDTKSYCGVLLDDNNRKPICRLHFNRKQKYIGIFDAEKKEERVKLESVEGIYALADKLRAAVSAHHTSATGDDRERREQK